MRLLPCVHCYVYTVMRTLLCVPCQATTAMRTLSCIHCHQTTEAGLQAVAQTRLALVDIEERAQRAQQMTHTRIMLRQAHTTMCIAGRTHASGSDHLTDLYLPNTSTACTAFIWSLGPQLARNEYVPVPTTTDVAARLYEQLGRV